MERAGSCLKVSCLSLLVAALCWPTATGHARDDEDERERYGRLAVDALREEIHRAEILLSDGRFESDDAMQAGILMRLGASYEELAQQLWFEQVRRADADLDSCLGQGRTDCPDLPEHPDAGAAERAHDALDAFERLREEYPGFERLDEALFRMAVIRQWLGDADGAVRGFTDLVRHHPRSAFAGDSWLAIGEARFEADYAYKALQAYEAALKTGSPDIAPYAQYKSGWCLYNLGEFDAAIEAMEAVVRESDRLQAEGEVPRIPIRDEALADLVLFLAEAEDLDAVLDRLGRLGRGPDTERVLLQLARVYEDQGQPDQAIAAWRGLIALDPMAAECPGWQASIVVAFWSGDRFEPASRELFTLLDSYGPRSRWVAAHADDPVALAEADDVCEQILRRTAVEAHDRGKKQDSRDLLVLAEDFYGRYLERFSSSPASYEMRFWHAELLYDLGRYDLAADEYTRVVEADPEGKYLREAALNTVFAIEKHLEGMVSDSSAPLVPR